MSMINFVFPTELIELPIINGEDNTLYDFLYDLSNQRSQISWIEVSDPNYQGISITEESLYAFCTRKNYNYWDKIWELIETCLSFEGVKIKFKALDSILPLNVPSTLPEATYLDENENVVNRTFDTWHQNPVGKGKYSLGDGYTIFVGNPGGVYLNNSQLLTLKAFFESNPAVDASFLTSSQYSVLKESISEEG